MERYRLATSGMAILLAGCAVDRSPAPRVSAAHRCSQQAGPVAVRGDVVCEAWMLGGEGNAADARADGAGASARALAGSLDLHDRGAAGGYLDSDDNRAVAVSTEGAGTLARAGANARGTVGARGNRAVARGAGQRAFADASAANGRDNIATAEAKHCIGAIGHACAFSVAGNGDGNIADAHASGRQARAQAGALDGHRNRASAAGSLGGKVFSTAQGGNRNAADASAQGKGAFASAQASGGDSSAAARADGDATTAGATAQNGGLARARAEHHGNATATASGKGRSAIAFASGPGTTATATHDDDADTGSCSGPGIAFAMTGGKFHCMQGF